MASKQAHRKPYHITKQREKWRVEEHDKFVEALELYGRGWPQITEYVGTKTIAQIRSHAQKFFKKLALPLPRIKTKPNQQPCTPRKHHGTIEDEDQELKKATKSSPSCSSSASSCIKLFGITMATRSDSSSSSSSNHVVGATRRDMTLLNLLV